jgi:hypothetical protein
VCQLLLLHTQPRFHSLLEKSLEPEHLRESVAYRRHFDEPVVPYEHLLHHAKLVLVVAESQPWHVKVHPGFPELGESGNRDGVAKEGVALDEGKVVEEIVVPRAGDGVVTFQFGDVRPRGSRPWMV